MKVKDIVKVKSNGKYKELEQYYGVIVEEREKQGHWQVAFLDMENKKALKMVEVKEEDLFMVINNIDAKGNQIKYLDQVELISDKYESKGIAKGQTGVVLELQAQTDCVLVDFTSVDKKLQVTGDCILVECKDLRIL